MPRQQIKEKNQPEKNIDLNVTEEFSERLILKKFLTDQTFQSFLAENADGECFSNGVIKKAMGIAIEYRNRGLLTPLTVDLLTELMKGSGCAEEAKLMPSYINLNTDNIDDEFAKEVVKKYIQGRKLFNLVFANSASLMKAKNFAPVLDGLTKIATLDFQSSLGFNYLEDVQEHIEYLTNPESRMSVGYSELDWLMGGGLPINGKCLLVLMAQAGLGKSMMMHNMAAKMVRSGKKILVITLEMTEQVYAARFSANFTECDINNLHSGGSVQKILQEVESMRGSHPEAGLIIKEFPPSSLRPAAVASYIDQLILSGWKPDAVFVDYLNIMIPNSSEKGDNTYVKVGETCKELRSLSYRFLIPFITATQTNRDGFDNVDVGMANISDSMGTGHHSDGIFALVSEGLETGIIKLIVLKNRFGGKVGAHVKFAFDTRSLTLTQITEVSEAEQNALEQAAAEISQMSPN